MSDEFVKREEFENLKKEVEEIRSELSKSAEILQKIDKKIDIIFERFENSNKLNELQKQNIETAINAKIEPLKKDISSNTEEIKEIKDTNKWIIRTVAGTIIGIVIKLIFDITRMVV